MQDKRACISIGVLKKKSRGTISATRACAHSLEFIAHHTENYFYISLVVMLTEDLLFFSA